MESINTFDKFYDWLWKSNLGENKYITADDSGTGSEIFVKIKDKTYRVYDYVVIEDHIDWAQAESYVCSRCSELIGKGSNYFDYGEKTFDWKNLYKLIKDRENKLKRILH